MIKITDVAYLENIYKRIKEEVIKSGYEKEIEWCNNIPPIEKLDKNYFFREYAWVVINSGMKNTVAKKIFESFLIDNGGSFRINFQAVTHPNKNKALRSVWNNLDRIFNRFKQSYNKLNYLECLPHIGPITKFHLARNLGLDYAKPDRHLVKIALEFGHSNVQKFCKEVSETSGDKIGLVDLVFWRFAVLNNNYLEVINVYKRFAERLYGLSEDMEDFILEQNDYYFRNKTKFWSSFWKTCSEMWSNDVDLSNKQLDIISKEYNKIKGAREKEALKTIL